MTVNKITEALAKMLPEEHVAEVTKAVEEMVAVRVEELETEFQAKLDEAYEQLAEERRTDESQAEAGYEQAYQIITSLMSRIDEQRDEFETALEEGYEEAFKELQAEREKNANLEVDVYKEYDSKLQEMKELMVDKIDQFLSMQEQEIYESAKRDVLADPHMLEQRVAIERVAEILSDYLGNEGVGALASSKLEESNKAIENLKGQVRMLEAKNVNLSRVNGKLGEQVREAKEMVTEATKAERKERTNKKEVASGRGQRVVNEQIVAEYAAPTKPSNDSADLTEGHDPIRDLLVLSGLAES